MQGWAAQGLTDTTGWGAVCAIVANGDQSDVHSNLPPGMPVGLQAPILVPGHSSSTGSPSSQNPVPAQASGLFGAGRILWGMLWVDAGGVGVGSR